MSSSGGRPDSHQRIINESLELLYGDHGDVINGINQLCKSELLEDIVQNHQLMSALARLLGDDTNRPLEMLFLLGKLFLSLSMIIDFHQILLNQRVGALTLAVVELEVKRAQQRIGTDSSSTFSGQLYFSKQQGRVLFICLSILNNLAEDSAILKKMIKRSLVDLVIQCIPSMIEQAEHLLVAISLLMKTSAIVDTARDILKVGSEAIVRLTFLLNIPQNGVLCEVIITLFNLSFHQECIDLISADEKIHSRLLALLSNHFICNYSLKLLYHLSSRQKDRQKLHEASITPCLIELLACVDELDESFAGLLVNMTLHPQCCEEWMRLVGIEPVLRIIKESQRVERKQILLKVSRNLSSWTKRFQCAVKLALEIQDTSPLTGIVRDPEAIIHRPKFWYGHAHQTIQSMFACENDDLLVEWMGFINNLTCDDLPAEVQWINQLDINKDRMIKIFDKLHDSRCHDDIKLELIILFGELCSIKECCEWVASTGLLDVIHNVFVETSDPEIRLQILFIYERCLVCEVTRSPIIDRAGVVGGIVDCLMNGESCLQVVAEMCLLLIEDCDFDTNGMPGPISASIQEKRYEVLMNG